MSGEWQDISTAPKDKWAEALVFDGYGVSHVYRHPDGEWIRVNLGPEDEDSIVDDITHWMPLPEAP